MINTIILYGEIYDKNIHTLYLNSNEIIRISNGIGQLQNLRELYLRYNNITQIPNEIGQLRNLRKLELNDNQIIKIPNEIGQLQNLRELYLNNNKITQIPNEIGKLRNLQIFYLNNNNIIIIPANIIQCNNLRQITYHGNNIEHNIPCVQRFLDRIRNAGGTIINMYNDKQNVHTSSIQTSIKNSIFHLLNVNYIINEMNNYIEDLVLTIKTKQLITEWVSLSETHSDLDCTFEEIFKAVW